MGHEVIFHHPSNPGEWGRFSWSPDVIWPCRRRITRGVHFPGICPVLLNNIPVCSETTTGSCYCRWYINTAPNFRALLNSQLMCVTEKISCSTETWQRTTDIPACDGLYIENEWLGAKQHPLLVSLLIQTATTCICIRQFGLLTQNNEFF
jgi:hypothetical protein